MHTIQSTQSVYLEPHDLKSISSQSWLGSGAVFKDKAKPARAIYPSHFRSASRLDSTVRGAFKSCHRNAHIVQFSTKFISYVRKLPPNSPCPWCFTSPLKCMFQTDIGRTGCSASASLFTSFKPELHFGFTFILISPDFRTSRTR